MGRKNSRKRKRIQKNLLKVSQGVIILFPKNEKQWYDSFSPGRWVISAELG